MRRKRITEFHPVKRRNGVIASVMHRNRSAQTPVSFVRSLSGLTLRLLVRAAHTSQAAGPRLATNASGFTMNRTTFNGMRLQAPGCRLQVSDVGGNAFARVSARSRRPEPE